MCASSIQMATQNQWKSISGPQGVLLGVPGDPWMIQMGGPGYEMGSRYRNDTPKVGKLHLQAFYMLVWRATPIQSSKPHIDMVYFLSPSLDILAHK